jgi:hypothetical protein
LCIFLVARNYTPQSWNFPKQDDRQQRHKLREKLVSFQTRITQPQSSNFERRLPLLETTKLGNKLDTFQNSTQNCNEQCNLQWISTGALIIAVNCDLRLVSFTNLKMYGVTDFRFSQRCS